MHGFTRSFSIGGQATLLTKFKAPVVNKLIIKNEVKIIIGVPTLLPPY